MLGHLAWCNKFTNSQESVIDKERSGPSVNCFDGGQVFLYRQHFLDYEQTSWIKMCIVDLVKQFSYWSHLRVNGICAKSFCLR